MDTEETPCLLAGAFDSLFSSGAEDGNATDFSQRGVSEVKISSGVKVPRCEKNIAVNHSY